MKRNKDGIIQDCDVYIGRANFMGGWQLRASKWANPFPVKQCKSIQECTQKFEDYIRGRPDLLADIHELEGMTLGCWCKPGPCHGDVLVKIFMEQQQEKEKEKE
jgi:hypothetical protein